MRYFFPLCMLFVCAAMAETGAARVDLNTKLMRRFDPGHAALRRSHAIANGHSFSDPHAGVVLGSRDPELLLRWKLMPYVARAYHFDAAIRDAVRQKWLERGAQQHLGRDFWEKLCAAAGPFIEADLENTRLTIELRTTPQGKR